MHISSLLTVLPVFIAAHAPLATAQDVDNGPLARRYVVRLQSDQRFFKDR